MAIIISCVLRFKSKIWIGFMVFLILTGRHFSHAATNATEDDFETIPYAASNANMSDMDAVNTRLTEMLMKRHVSKGRPVSHPKEKVKVNLLSALYQIVEVDQRSNLATISAYFDLWWRDKYLTWNASDFGDASETYLPGNAVWTPDLYLYHSVQGSTPLAVQEAAVQIRCDGRVRVFIPFTARALCTINVKYFPFDVQRCSFVFGSWSYRLENVEYIVSSGEVLLADFYDNQEWVLINSTLEKTTSFYTNYAFNETYSTVTLNVTLKRQPFYYVFNLVVPVTLVTVVSVIGFHVPANSSERRESKFRLGIMTLLSMGVLLLNVVTDMPKFSMTSEPGQRGSFSDVPLLGLFYLALILIISVGTITTGIFVALEKHALHHPFDIPFWLRWLDYDLPNMDTVARWRKTRQAKNERKAANHIRTTPFVLNDCDGADLSILSSGQLLKNARDEQQLVPANCVGLVAGSPTLTPKVNTPLRQHYQRNETQTTCSTPPSYRRAILSTSKLQNNVSSLDEENGNIFSTGSPVLSTASQLNRICGDILFEIKTIRQSMEKVDVATCEQITAEQNSESHPHPRHTLTKSWSRVMHRFEALSLAIYLCLVGTALIMFFAHTWY